ncbi:hypothetical protein FPQ18DRAFT_305496 [Pyronema domesticum]|nr:hypothetical protein FPQ18DRAFT_305496 [Pyronema domesticum]
MTWSRIEQYAVTIFRSLQILTNTGIFIFTIVGVYIYKEEWMTGVKTTIFLILFSFFIAIWTSISLWQFLCQKNPDIPPAAGWILLQDMICFVVTLSTILIGKYGNSLFPRTTWVYRDSITGEWVTVGPPKSDAIKEVPPEIYENYIIPFALNL